VINERQIGLLLAKLAEAGYTSERQKYDWLYDQGVNVNDFAQLGQLSNQRFNALLALL
jgi:hypothetical protein